MSDAEGDKLVRVAGAKSQLDYMEKVDGRLRVIERMQYTLVGAFLVVEFLARVVIK